MVLKGNELIVSKLLKIPNSQLFNCLPILQYNQCRQLNQVLWISEKRKKKINVFQKYQMKIKCMQSFIF